MQHLQSEQSSEQNTVRTDFTLKYFELDDAFNKSTLVKVSSKKAENFIRSWQSFSLSRGDCLISWTEGGLEGLYSSCATIKGSPIENLEQLASFLQNTRFEVSQKKVLFINAELAKPQDVRSVLEIYQGFSDSDKKPFNLLFFVESRERFNAEYASFNNILGTELLLDGIQASEKVSSISFNKKIVISLFALIGIAVAWQGWQYYFSNLQTQPLVDTSAQVNEKREQAEAANKNDSKVIPAADLVNQMGSASEAVPGSSVAASSAGQAKETMTVTTLDTASSVVSISPEPLTPSASVVTASAVVKSNVVKNTATDSDELTVKGTTSAAVVIDEGIVEEPPTAQSEQKAQQLLPRNGETSVGITSNTSSDALKKEPRTEKKEQVKISAASGQSVIELKPVITLESDVSEVAGESPVKSEQAIFQEFLDRWVKSWQQQNFEDYRHFYGDNFSGRKGFDHQQWLTWRKKRIEKPAWIKLSYANLIAKKSVSEDEYILTFTLKYSAPNYRDETEKRLIIKRLNSDIKILKEENLKVTRL